MHGVGGAQENIFGGIAIDPLRAPEEVCFYPNPFNDPIFLFVSGELIEKSSESLLGKSILSECPVEGGDQFRPAVKRSNDIVMIRQVSNLFGMRILQI